MTSSVDPSVTNFTILFLLVLEIASSLVNRIQESSSCHLQIVVGIRAAPGIDWGIERE
jgi:hypothetical protein